MNKSLSAGIAFFERRLASSNRCRSVYHPLFTPSTEVLSTNPLYTTLAGIGTDRQVPRNDMDDSALEISLTPDQDTTPWTLSDPTLHSFSMDPDQATNYTDTPESVCVLFDPLCYGSNADQLIEYPLM